MRQESQSGQVAFRPRARLMKLLGAELISDEVVAVTELVKNAHDADASTVVVTFKSVTGGDGEIVITDDGLGMDRETLLGRWMEPASSWKGERERRTGRGRRVLGEKGVGRFAADKLAARLELISRRAGQDDEVRAVFDWDRFSSDDQMLSDVKCRWEQRPASVVTGQGTVLRMSGLRAAWSERMFRRLSTRLTRLISAFEEVDGFRIIIESDEFPEYSGELRTDFLDRAPYRIDASFDGEQTVEVNVNGTRSTAHLWNGTGDLRCGPVRVRLFTFDLETGAIARIGPRMEVRAWLKEWTGVSIYRDGFRVWPYGEPHDDWLRLDQRRVNNPVVRLSNNQIVGFVQISSDGNPQLRDQTNREGLIHNRGLNDLRRLMYFVLQILEAERQKVRHPPQRNSTAGSRNGNGWESIPAQLDKVARRVDPALRDELKRIARRVDETLAKEESEHRKFVEGYSGLAALGQAAVGLDAAVRPLLDRVRAGCDSLNAELNGRGSRRLRSQLKTIESTLGLIDTRLGMVTPMDTGSTHRRRRAIDVPAELEVSRSMLQPLLEEAGVEMELDVPRRGVLRVEMRPETFHRVMHILASNSLDWLHRIKKPRIRVRARVHDGECEIVFSDNGPGIPEDLADRVFDPLFSGKEGGQGMGLTIARHIVELHGGSISVLVDGRRRGANVRIRIPRKRSRATLHRH